jgi:hypothetical protein
VGGELLAVGMAQPALAAPADLKFDVFRKGSHIGTHAIQFASSGDGLAVASQLELAVKVAFSTVYGYEQIGRDE